MAEYAEVLARPELRIPSSERKEAARADYLITGNRKHFPDHWLQTKVINARELLNIIGPHLPG